MRHGEERRVDSDNPDLVFGLSCPMSEWLILDRALCRCELRCECDDPKGTE
jgi:hypothetical protein